MEQRCQLCGKSFHAKPSHVEKGKARYCSKSCWHNSPEIRANTIKTWTGRKHTAETIEKIKIKRAKQARENHPNWNGGMKWQHGYALVLAPHHPFANSQGYVKRSRLAMEKHLGRFLRPEEVVHHKGAKNDDRIEMLQLFSGNSPHLRFHYSQRIINKSGQLVPCSC